jgi:hypothetical protein
MTHLRSKRRVNKGIDGAAMAGQLASSVEAGATPAETGSTLSHVVQVDDKIVPTVMIVNGMKSPRALSSDLVAAATKF